MLEEITKRLDTRIDILHLRAVCKTWRSSIPFPSLTLNPMSHLLLKENVIYCLEPDKEPNEKATNCWFVKIEEMESGKVCVKDPLSGLPIEDINRSLPKKLNLLDYRVREVFKHYYLQFVGSGKEPIPLMIKKVVVGQRNED